MKHIFDYLSGNHSLEEFSNDFQIVTRSQAIAVLEIGGKLLVDAILTLDKMIMRDSLDQLESE